MRYKTIIILASTLLLLLSCATTVKQAGSQDAFIKLIETKAKQGDRIAIRNLILPQNLSAELVTIQANVITVAISDFEIVERVKFQLKDWTPKPQVMTQHGRKLRFNSPPDLIVEYHFKTEAPSTGSSSPGTGLFILPIKYQDGAYRIVGYSYEDN